MATSTGQKGPATQEPLLFTTEMTPDPATQSVPHRMTDDVHIPAERYYSEDFAALEANKLWLRTWQWAARVEDVPHVGDYIVYDVADETAMVVRTDADTIKVFHNVCPHRATKLADGCGTFRGGQIVCPFHGWRWKLNGEMSYLYGRHAFDQEAVADSVVGLKEIRSEIRYGFVWITFDDDAVPFDEFIAPIDKNIAPLAIERMRMRWWKYQIVPANWKVALEAFMEGYHVMQAHPEIAMFRTGDDYNPDSYKFRYLGNGHTMTASHTPPPGEKRKPAMTGMDFGEWFLEHNRVMFEGTDSYTTIREEMVADRIRHRDLEDDQIVPSFVQEFRAYCKDAGIELPPPDPDAAGFAYVFPNMVFLGTSGNLLFYRVRPHEGDPNQCRYEVFALQIPTPDNADLPPVRPQGPLKTSDWPFVLRQDIENVERQQAGYRSPRFQRATMSVKYETMIFGMHNEIDRYLADEQP
ncbi:aromatic ring-hydroxylating dioxygenase subunit alpha [Streptomyces sp. NPDC048106]|uniref:aromatic ring-hydroxylating oxygenase subunit alpha n=1 Tax=Streptomyces sp. NPDC048106 TaxID=3155750 RepID=UPI00345189AF